MHVTRCLYLLPQFHMTEKHEVDWSISLGAYEPGSANWTLTNTSLSGLYPHFTKARPGVPPRLPIAHLLMLSVAWPLSDCVSI